MKGAFRQVGFGRIWVVIQLLVIPHATRCRTRANFTTFTTKRHHIRHQMSPHSSPNVTTLTSKLHHIYEQTSRHSPPNVTTFTSKLHHILLSSVSLVVSSVLEAGRCGSCAAAGALTNLHYPTSVTHSGFSTLLKGTCVYVWSRGLNQQPLQEQWLYHLCHRRSQGSYNQQSRRCTCACTRRQRKQIKTKRCSSLIAFFLGFLCLWIVNVGAGRLIQPI